MVLCQDLMLAVEDSRRAVQGRRELRGDPDLRFAANRTVQCREFRLTFLTRHSGLTPHHRGLKYPVSDDHSVIDGGAA
jgi:hypothetical protein